jgi:hypothetical protein
MSHEDAISLKDHRLLIDACLKHNVSFWWHGPGLLLISGEGIRKIVSEVTALGVRVIGLEGFELESTVIHPRLDRIFDSDVSNVEPVSLLATWGDDIWVDVTLDSQTIAD